MLLLLVSTHFLTFFSKCIDSVTDDSYDFMITGDYNLPAIDWQMISVCLGGTLEMQ